MPVSNAGTNAGSIDPKTKRPTRLTTATHEIGYHYDKHGRIQHKTKTPLGSDGKPLKQSDNAIVGYKESLQLFYNPNDELEKSITIHQQGITLTEVTTTSLMVPLAGSGVFTLKQIYPFTLGANIGTCITALLAATAVVGNTKAALTIATIHLMYNVIGVIVIYGLPFLRQMPPNMAMWLGRTAADNKLFALAYIAGVFFVLPLICVGVSTALGA